MRVKHFLSCAREAGVGTMDHYGGGSGRVCCLQPTLLTAVAEVVRGGGQEQPPGRGLSPGKATLTASLPAAVSGRYFRRLSLFLRLSIPSWTMWRWLRARWQPSVTHVVCAVKHQKLPGAQRSHSLKHQGQQWKEEGDALEGWTLGHLEFNPAPLQGRSVS